MSDDTRSSSSSSSVNESDHPMTEEKIGDSGEQQIGELAPIPTLEELTRLAAIDDSVVRTI